MDQVRIGIIGVGNMGSGHAKTITSGQVPDMVLTAIADINPERRKWAAETYPDVKVFDDAITMMESGLVDAVIVATPHYDHPPLVTAALKRDIHVMCEKPAGVYTKAVAEVNELAKKSKATYAIMFNQRTNCVYRKMKEIISSGELGSIRRVNWLITNWFRPQSYYDSGAWRATWAGEGGGVLLNQCPHNLDLFQWLVGMPVRVRAFTHNGLWHDIEVEDDVTAYMEFENGATGVFITSTGDAPGTNRQDLDPGKAGNLHPRVYEDLHGRLRHAQVRNHRSGNRWRKSAARGRVARLRAAPAQGHAADRRRYGRHQRPHAFQRHAPFELAQ